MTRSLDEQIEIARRATWARPFRTTMISRRSAPALDMLRADYDNWNPICLFTGAGVSLTSAADYPAPKDPGEPKDLRQLSSWDRLLFDTYAMIRHKTGGARLRLIDPFKELSQRHAKPWDLATALARQAGGEVRMLAAMRRVLVGRTGRDHTYKRLPKAYLGNASTLNAVIAFCSRLRAIRANPCYCPNPRVRALLTLNYDWFLEGGATQKYNANPFKPMASLESREIPDRLPVYHIHGYVPHRLTQRPRYPLILTKRSYDKAYRKGTFTRQTLDLLNDFTTVFIGVSFSDELLLKHLVTSARKATRPAYFALLKRGDLDQSLLRHLRHRARVQPILYSSHDDVPSILGHVYTSTLTASRRRVPLEITGGERVLSPRDYWSLLLWNKE